MTNLKTFASHLLIASAVVFTAVPAVAFDGATDFAPGGNGPDPWEPGGFAPNPTGGGGGGGGGAVSHGGGDGYIANTAPDPCPNGELRVSFEMDADGHPIPTSFSRECVVFR
ncbi:hypothetical protein [Gymnodinialimonas hymeniacidonis]|uniref:hypothetical protein n=1 Tax=Gymnodinialimonas hymeniacidonis TaxID=3126508 RepID=UPI0034C5E270